MDLRAIFLTLGYISRLYILGMAFLVAFYVFRHASIHRQIWRVSKEKVENIFRTIDQMQSHCSGLRQAEHVALGLGRALFAAQLSQLLLMFLPMFRATYINPWFSVPQYVIICQLCFLPALILLFMDWLLSAHLRKITLPL